MSTRILLLPLITAILLTVACAPISTDITATKAFPENNTAPLEKVLVVVISDNLPVRSLFEQEMKKRLEKQGVKAMGSLEAMPGDAKIDREAFETYFKAQNINAILLSHIIDREKMALHVEPQEYSGTGPRTYWAGYYDYYYQMYDRTSEPGHFQESELLLIESSLFAVKNSEMIWTCQSKSVHRDNARDIIDDLTKMTVKAMKEDGIFN